MKSMHTKETTNNNSRKRARTAGGGGSGPGDHAGRVGRNDDTQLRAQGYEVRPEVIVDDFGMRWELLDKVSVIFSYFLFSTLTLDP
jgi:hypothetical protein